MAKKEQIVVNKITVAQLNRGNQDVQSWIAAVRAAESSINPNRKPLLNTYLDVSIDLHLDSVMEKRMRAVRTVPFEWLGLNNDTIKQNFKSPWFAELLSLIQSRIFWGTTLAEIQLGKSGLIEEVNMIPRQNVKPELGLISLDGISNTGINYREGIYKNYILEIGRKDDLGLLAKIAPYVLMKRVNLADFMRYNEMFGMPLRVYEYDPLKPGAREEMKNQAEEYGSAAYIVIPKGFGGVTFHDSTKQSSTYAYDKAHTLLNNEITIGVLGQLLTTGGAKGGSYSLGKVHKSVEESLNMADRLMAEYVINYPFKNDILIPHGYPLEGIRGKFRVAEEIDKETRLKLWIDLYNSGAKIAEEDFYKEFGITPPGKRPTVKQPNQK